MSTVFVYLALDFLSGVLEFPGVSDCHQLYHICTHLSRFHQNNLEANNNENGLHI